MSGERISPVGAPYYQDDSITLYHGDASEIFPHLRADAIVTDPPYLGARGQSWQGQRAPLVVDYAPATIEMLGHLVESAATVLGHRGWFVAFQDFPGMLALRDLFAAKNETGWLLLHAPIPWLKPKGAFVPCGSANSIPKSVDFLTAARVGKGTHEVARDGYYTSAPYSPKTILRTGGKPVQLMRDVLADFVPTEGTVLDPFAGSGTTLMAAAQTGRRAIGIEVEEPKAQLDRDL